MIGFDRRNLYEQLLSKGDERFPEDTPIDANELNYNLFLRSTLPAGWTADVPHIKLIGEHLDAVDRGEIDRLAIHMPPRHGKSETVTYRYPVRRMLLHPTENVLITGYNERFARKFGRRTRNIAKGFGLSLDPEKQAADEWAMSQGGILMTRGVGSPPTGTGFNRIVIDDPVRRRQDAESETFRNSVWDWYTDDLYTRLEPGGAIILIMTLWHEDDLGARAVASEPGAWTVLKLPAFAIEDDLLGRSPGQALWPERYDVDSLLRIKDVQVKNDGERSFEALYQQNPTPRDGSIFKASCWQYYKAIPTDLEEQICSWDMTFKSTDGSDYVVGQCWGRRGADRFLLHQIRARMTFTETCDAVIELSNLYPLAVTKLVEDAANGPAVMNALRTKVAGLIPVTPQSIGGSKAARAYAVEPLLCAGNLHLPDPKVFAVPWISAFITEHSNFPNGKNDDQVDATTLANVWWSLNRAASWLDLY